MAYKNRDFGVLAYANGFTIWRYNPQGEDFQDIIAADYFNAAADMVRVGDMIIVSTVNDKSAKGCILHVCGLDDGRVDTESVTPGGLLFFGGLATLPSNHAAQGSTLPAQPQA